MTRFTMRIVNAKQLQARLADASEALQKEVKLGIRESAKAIRRDARANAPVLSGDLKKSIRFRTTDSGFGALIRVGEFYGRFVEFGTQSQEAQPFFRPALELERKRFRGRFAEATREAMGLK